LNYWTNFVIKCDKVMYSAKHNTYIANNTQFRCMFLFQWTTFRPVLNIQTWCIHSVRTLWDPYCLQTSLILKFKLKLYWPIYLKIYEKYIYILQVILKLLSNGRITWVACLCTWLKTIFLLIWVYSKFWRLFYHKFGPSRI